MCVFVLLGNAARTWSGKTLGVPLQTQAVRLPVSSTAGEVVCLWAGWEEADERMETGEYCRPQKQREPHQPL